MSKPVTMIATNKAYSYVLDNFSDIAIIQYLRSDVCACFTCDYEEATGMTIKLENSALIIKRVLENTYEIHFGLRQDNVHIKTYNIKMPQNGHWDDTDLITQNVTLHQFYTELDTYIDIGEKISIR